MPFPYCCQFEISQLLQGLSVRKHNSVGPVSLAGLDIKTFTGWGSGCSTAGRVVASNTRGTGVRIESPVFLKNINRK